VRTEDGWEGAVIHVDRFGNLTTNLLEADLEALAGRGIEGLEVSLGGRRLPLVRFYSEVETGEACALVGSSGRLEIAVNRGRADALFGTGPHAPAAPPSIQPAGVRVCVRRRGAAC